MTVKRIEVQGDVAYMVWHFTNDSVDIELGTDTFLIRDGKIVLQTFAARIEPKGR